MMKTTFLYLLLMYTILVNAQCPYPVANTQNGATQTFCINNPNQVITINNMNGTRFLLVNVVQGFTYNFSVGNVYAANTENLNVYDASTNTSLVFASGASGASISNWVSTLSGQIKLVLSLDACVVTNLTNLQVTIEVVNIGNTLDNQNSFGTDNWVGHVYNWTDATTVPGGASPTTPSITTSPFLSSNYVGFYNIATEAFVEGFGGNDVCLQVRSSGVVRTNIRTETFAVRYRMNSTRAAGCYIATFRGDDGIRLYNDGELVFNRWLIQGPTNYNNVLIYLDGSADLILDFYENQTQNVVDFSLTPFNSSLNDILSPLYPTVCSGVTPLSLNGSSFLYNGTTINPTIAFQWQSSTDNITFANITGATNEDYTPPAITTATTVIRYYRRVMSAVATNAGACSFTSNSVSITTTGGSVVAVPATVPVSAVNCTQFTANWNAYTGATSYLIEVSTNNTFTAIVSGYNLLNIGNVTSYIVTGLAINTQYYYRIRAISSCGLGNAYNSSNTRTLGVPSNPAVSVPDTALCDTFTATWSPSTNATSYIIDIATTNTFNVGTFLPGYQGLVLGTNTFLNVTLPNTTTYPIYYRVRAVGPCGTSGNSGTRTVNDGTTTTTWNGITWSNGTPTLSTKIIINGTYDMSIQPSFDACTVTVNNPFVVTVTANKYVNIQNQLTVNTGATFTINDDASLVQISNTVTNTGNISLLRNTNVKLQDYVYWSSPVAGFNVASVSPSSTLIYKWDATDSNANGGQGDWLPSSGTMANGEGYIVRTPAIAPYVIATANSFTANFTGVPNNGLFSPTIKRGIDYTTLGLQGIPRTATDDNWNLLGNPYPSAIGVNEFLTANASIEGFVKIWTHGNIPSTFNADPFYQNFVSNYDPNDYVTVNPTGATSGPGDYKIGSGQGFMVLMDAGVAGTSTVTFDNNMRSKDFLNNQFYRTSNTSTRTTAAIERNRIWLDLVSSTQTNRILVGYIEGATQAKDRLYDAFTDYKNSQNFYSILDDEILLIQGRSLPFANIDQVPLGFKVATNGSYTIAVGAVDGLFSGNAQMIYLEDKLLNVVHNLSTSPYSFTANQGIVNNRFVLRYTDAALSNSDFDLSTNQITVYASNDVVKIDSKKENIKSYIVYDVLGRILITKNNINSKQSEIVSLLKNNQALIVKTTLENGQVVTKKIVF